MSAAYQISPHPSDDELELYALGRLDDTRAAELQEHLKLCDRCCLKVADDSDFGSGMRS